MCLLFIAEALPEVLQASGGRVEVYLDGGIRRGTDVIKARFFYYLLFITLLFLFYFIL